MEDLTLGQIVTAIAIITGLAGGIGYFAKPIFEMLKRLHKVEEHQDSDLKRLDQLESDNKELLKSVNVMLSHMINDNDKEKLIRRKAELDDYMIAR